MPTQRGYRDACGIAHALDLVGERWALLVVRELLLGPKRFTDLRRGLPAASPNAIAERLRDLTAVGVLRRRRLPPPAASWVYELTDWGRELEPIVISLGTWAVRSALMDGTGHLSVDSVMLTIRTYFRDSAARRRPGGAESRGSATIEVRLLGEDRFGVWLHPDGADTRHEVPPDPDAVIDSDAASLVAAFGDPGGLRRALADSSIVVAGQRSAAVRLIEGVAVPDAAPPQARR
jgi:DNA-binding HxlR family transcriptional regulator